MSQLVVREFTEEHEVFEVQTEVTTVSYTWNFAGIDLELAEYVTASSPIFFAKKGTEPSWFLSLQHTNSGVDYLSVFVLMVAEKNPQVRGKFRLYLYSNKGEEAKTEWSTVMNFRANAPVRTADFIKCDWLDNFMYNNLKVRCEISYMVNDYGITEQKEIEIYNAIEKELHQDIEYLLSNDKFCDVTFSVEESEMRAHKAILAAQSKIFADMFVGHKDDCIAISDLSIPVFKEMINFIYTGDAPNVKMLAGELLAAAQNYDLPKLKRMCVQSLGDNLSIRTSIATLILADEYCAYELKTKAIDFINSNIADVIKTKEWNNMAASHCHLIFEAFETFGKRSTV